MLDPHLARALDLLTAYAGVHVPAKPLCPDHDAPLAYLVAAIAGERDLVVWACRGGGKTLLAAVATFLEMLRAPGRAIRILAGSRAQGTRTLEYLDRLCTLAGESAVTRRSCTRIELANGSSADVLAHAQTAVRGHHVDTLRCDEVELFDADVFTAALFTPDRPGELGDRSAEAGGHVEALSTLHQVGGLMSKLVEQASITANVADQPAGTSEAAPSLQLIRWCLMDVIERCAPSRSCSGCVLWADCQGRARHATGFVPVESAIRLRQRVSRQAWESEAMCRRPSRADAVFPQFDPARHVHAASYDARLPLYRTIDLGFTNPSICLWLQKDENGVVRVLDELQVRRTSLAEFARLIHERTPGPVVATFSDPAAGQHTVVTASSVADELRTLGIPIRYQASRIADGVEQIRAALDATPPRLLVAPRCANVLTSLTCYRYPRVGESAGSSAHARAEAPVKDGIHDHAIDALRYFFVGIRHAGGVSQAKY